MSVTVNGTPRLSVVVASAGSRAQRDQFLEILEAQALQGPGVEVLVVEREDVASSEARGVVKFIGSSHRALPELWGQGIATARGEWIAILETSCLPTPDWLSAVQAPGTGCAVGLRWRRGNGRWPRRGGLVGLLLRVCAIHASTTVGPNRRAAGKQHLFPPRPAGHGAAFRGTGFLENLLDRRTDEEGHPARVRACDDRFIQQALRTNPFFAPPLSSRSLATRGCASIEWTEKEFSLPWARWSFPR